MAAVGTSQIGYRSKFYFLGIFRRGRFAEGNSFSAFCTVNRKIPFAGLDKAGHGEILGEKWPAFYQPAYDLVAHRRLVAFWMSGSRLGQERPGNKGTV
jgi:hypothetical protein